MSLIIYIDEVLVDLRPGTIFSTTITGATVNNLSTRSVSHSNQITLPPTATNNALFQNVQELTSDASKPFTRLSARIIQDGNELPLVYAVYDGFDDGHKVVFFESGIDLFKTIETLNLKQLACLSNSAWNAAGIDSARLATSGVMTSIVDWGKGTPIFQLNYFLPTFYYHSFITCILEYTGLTLSGSILTDARFKDLVMTFPNDFKYNDEFINGLGSQARKVDPVSNTGIITGTEVDIEFEVVDFGAGFFDGITYTVDRPCVLSIDCYLEVDIDALNDGISLSVIIQKNGVTNLTIVQFSSLTPEFKAIQYTGEFTTGDTIKMIATTFNAPVIGIDVTFPGAGDSYLNITANNTINRSEVYWNELFDSVRCIDLVRDFFNRFGILAYEDMGVLYLKTIQEVITDRASALDWSGKLANIKETEIEINKDYAAANIFKYKEVVGEVGRGSIDISTQVNTTKDLFTSIFENCLTPVIGFSYKTASIPVYDSTSTGIDDFKNKPGLKLLTLKDRTSQLPITFNATPRTDYKIAYFVDSNASKDTGFQYFIDQFYSTFESALQKGVVVTKYFNLTTNDIAQYNRHKIIFDGTNYYLLVKIPNFVPGKITKVELFRV